MGNFLSKGSFDLDGGEGWTRENSCGVGGLEEHNIFEGTQYQSKVKSDLAFSS